MIHLGSTWLSERQALTVLWTHQFLFILAPHANTGPSTQALWHFSFLDLVSSLLDLCGPSSQDQTADLGPTPPLALGRQAGKPTGPGLSMVTLPLQPGVCF